MVRVDHGLAIRGAPVTESGEIIGKPPGHSSVFERRATKVKLLTRSPGTTTRPRGPYRRGHLPHLAPVARGAASGWLTTTAMEDAGLLSPARVHSSVG